MLKNPTSTFKLALSICLLVVFGCKKEDRKLSISEWKGSGVVTFTDYEPLASKQVRVFYYVPEAVNAQTPIVFVLHGAERNAIDYRNAIINKALEHNFIAIVPEFSESAFPEVNGYQIGNIYQNGDLPSPNTLNPEAVWSLSIIEPLFAFVKNKTRNESTQYQLIGHSGGAQFAHRFLLFKPQAKYDKVIVSAAGWYTTTQNSIVFPYGLKDSPLESTNLSNLFAKKILVQVGTADNNPNSSSIRKNEYADAQGPHRLARAQHFFETAQATANGQSADFNWEFHLIPGLSHDYVAALGHSADLIFN